MRPTPPIDEWIRSFSHPAYRNVYELELCCDEPRLFGTESLFGDWDAEVLFLAQDFAASAEIERRCQTCRRPYHHRHWPARGRPMGATTNKRLYRFACELPVPKLYGSALGGLLKFGDDPSAAPPDFERLVKSYCVPLLEFVAEHAPNLRAVACLGGRAWVCAAAAFGQSGPARAGWARLRDAEAVVEGAWGDRTITLHPLYHTGARKSIEALQKGWPALRDRLVNGHNRLRAHTDPPPDICPTCTPNPG